MRTLIVLLLLSTTMTFAAAPVAATHMCADWAPCFHPWDPPGTIVRELREWPNHVCTDICQMP